MSRPRNAVLILECPDDFTPTRPWHLPDRVVAAELHSKNLPLRDAQTFVRLFNRNALQKGLPGRLWAVVVRYTRFHWGTEGGAV